jgi:hypothetical protein
MHILTPEAGGHCGLMLAFENARRVDYVCQPMVWIKLLIVSQPNDPKERPGLWGYADIAY